MFRAEIYRVFSRKAGLAAMLAGLFFILYYTMGNTVWGEGLVDEGRIYYGKEAIRRDKEIAAEFSGPLTEDVVRAIWEKYGPPVNYANRSTTKEGLEAAAATGGNDNYCNRAMTSLFGEEIVGEDGEVTYALAEGWTESRYLQGGYTFGYTGSSRWFWDRFMMAYQLAYITIIVFLCPMFSEDYAFRTTDIILPAAKGRFRLWRLRLAVGCFLASAYYWLACGSIFLLYIAYYGTEGLSVSCGLAGVPMFFPEDDISMGKGLLMLYLCGWAAAVVLAALVCAVSAASRQSFSSLVRSLALYIGPFAFMRLVLDSLPRGRVNSLLHMICYSMPLSFCGSYVEVSHGERWLMAAVALAAAVSGAAVSARRYCHHQVGR
ncbi:MAG: hypothetical protein HFH95_03240 [Lachnospiraceae bacterium]|nr:hypothetical protein [uncultured Acetatifactor sp.]MCI8542322.1 hypothetical protein [Lachnospiraceae bacterium]